MRYNLLLALLLAVYPIRMTARPLLYRIANFFQNPIEFRYPFSLTPYDLKAGFQITGLNADALQLDSTETTFESYDAIYTRMIPVIELDLMKVNFLQYLIPQNFIDFQTGIGARYALASIHPSLPNHWPQSYHQSKIYYAPRLMEGYLSQALLFQWHPNFYNYLQFNFGYAEGSAYKTLHRERYLNQEGYTFSVALGIKMLGRRGPKLAESFGLELKYSRAKFDDFPDRENLSPVKNLDFSSVGISLTYSSIMGGRKTQGDVAKKLFKEEDYIAAKANFQDFIRNNPKHPRLFKARWLIEECDDLMAFQQVNLAKEFIATNNYSKAARYLGEAAKSSYEVLQPTIAEKYDTVAQWFKYQLDSLLTVNRIEAAQNLLIEYDRLDVPETETQINQYWSEIYFHRGVVFARYRLWEKAIQLFDQAVKKYPEIRERVDPWLLRIAYGYIEDVNLSIDEKNVELALESLRAATALRPDIDFITREHIGNLEQGIRYLKEQAALQKLKKAVEATRLPPTKSEFSLQTGMTQAQIRETLGEPAYQNSLSGDRNQQYELWIYKLDDKSERYLYFNNGILAKIENYP